MPTAVQFRALIRDSGHSFSGQIPLFHAKTLGTHHFCSGRGLACKLPVTRGKPVSGTYRGERPHENGP
jgi:hypothetical protein